MTDVLSCAYLVVKMGDSLAFGGGTYLWLLVLEMEGILGTDWIEGNKTLPFVLTFLWGIFLFRYTLGLGEMLRVEVEPKTVRLWAAAGFLSYFLIAFSAFIVRYLLTLAGL